MKFSWNNFDESFLKEIIKVTEDVEDKELYLATDDKDAIISCVNAICDYPTPKFIMQYRQIIEQYVLFYYHNTKTPCLQVVFCFFWAFF